LKNTFTINVRLVGKWQIFCACDFNYLPIGPPGQLGQEQAGSEQPQNLIWTLAGMDTVPQLLLLVGGAAVVGEGCKLQI